MVFKAEVEMFAETVEGIVDEDISSSRRGRVKCLGSYWPAQIYDVDGEVSLVPEQKVSVIGRVGIILLVIPK